MILPTLLKNNLIKISYTINYIIFENKNILIINIKLIMMSENLSKSMKEESEILRIRDEITEFDLKLKNFGYEKQ